MKKNQHPTSKLGALDRLPYVLPRLSPLEGRVLTVMITRIGKEGLTFLGAASISAILELKDPRNVEKAISRLHELKYLTLAVKGGGRGNPNKWRVTLPETPANPTGVIDEESGSESGEETGVEKTDVSETKPRLDQPGNEPENPGLSAQETPVSSGAKPRLVGALNPGCANPPMVKDGLKDDLNTSLARARAGAVGHKVDAAIEGVMPAIPDPLNTPAFKRAWGDWIQHRREIRKPLKPMQARSQLNRLSHEGESMAVARIDRSIENGWQGLWFKDDNGKGLVKHGNGQRTKSTAEQRGEFAEPNSDIPDFVAERH